MKHNFFQSISVLGVTSDEQLMALLQKGNTLAFEKLYKKYQGNVLGYLVQIIKNKGVAEEVAQECFFKIYDKNSTFDLDRKFTPWMWKIVRNTTIDYFRKKKDLLFSDLFKNEISIEQFYENENFDNELELRLIKKNDREILLKSIDKLKKSQKELLLLHILSDLNYKELSESTGLSLSAVKSSLLRARQNLIKILKENR